MWLWRSGRVLLVIVIACAGAWGCGKSGSTSRTEGSTMSGELGENASYVERASAIVTWLEKGEHARVRATFDAAMKNALPNDAAVGELWSSIVAKLGHCTKQLGTREEELGKFHVVLVTCDFEQAPMDVRLVFDESRALSGLQLAPSTSGTAFGPRPQNPKPPFPYAARDVVYPNPTDRSALGATLTIPEGKGPHAAVVLITGSGTQDRDETIFGHKPFWVLADHLSRRGIAVLRVDDRGVGKTTGDPTGATIETHATDVEAGLAFLKTQPEIDAAHMGLMGHSEGGIIAALVAARSKDVAFVVSLAGTGLSGAEINPLQVEAILKAQGNVSAEGIAAIVAAQRKIMRAVADDADEATLKAAVAEAIAAAKKFGPPGTSDADLAASANIEVLRSPWFRSFVKLDPAESWSRVTVPVLALVGDKDTQVPADPNLGAIGAALRRAGNKDARTEKLAGLNHMFQTAQTGLLDEYGKLEETLSPKLLELVTSFIRESTGLR